MLQVFLSIYYSCYINYLRMNAPVCPHIAEKSKDLAALSTFILIRSRKISTRKISRAIIVSVVNALVLSEVRRLNKCLKALGTLVWPLARVKTLVICENHSLNKSPITICTLVRPLARVDALVDGERSKMCKSLVTICALVRPLARVDAFMNGEV